MTCVGKKKKKAVKGLAHRKESGAFIQATAVHKEKRKTISFVSLKGARSKPMSFPGEMSKQKPKSETKPRSHKFHSREISRLICKEYIGESDNRFGHINMSAIPKQGKIQRTNVHQVAILVDEDIPIVSIFDVQDIGHN